jgi:5-methyltetrahydropteroyltriglutamate--homocysteine methyltransferase
VFMPATAPSGVGINEHYKTEEEYFHALAAELNKEYKAVVAARFLIQVDDPFLPDIFFEPGLTDAKKGGAPKSMSRLPTRRSTASPPRGCVSTPATASTKVRAFTRPPWPTSWLIAERLIRFAKLVGRENVMAGADCGFSSQALYKTEVHPTVIWEKFKAMRQGADLATKQLWK